LLYPKVSYLQWHHEAGGFTNHVSSHSDNDAHGMLVADKFTRIRPGPPPRPPTCQRTVGGLLHEVCTAGMSTEGCSTLPAIFIKDDRNPAQQSSVL